MPDWMAEIQQRVDAARLDPATGAHVAEELAQHLEDVYRERVSRGASPEEARAAALSELESDVSLAVGLRRTQRVHLAPLAPGVAPGRPGVLSGLFGDVRYAARSLRRAPLFTVIAMLVIALGIAANTAIFSVVNTVLLQPLPGVRAPDRLAAIFTSDFSGPRYGASSYPDYEAIRAAGDVFESVTAFTLSSFSVSDGRRAVRVMGELVDHNYFGTLGVRPALGRFFLPEERAGAASAAIAVISHGLWQRSFGGAADVIGRTVRVNGQVLTIVGVAPPDFRGSMRGTRMDLWVPFSAPGMLRFNADERGNRGLFVTARLRAGVDAPAAGARLRVIAAQLHAAYPDSWTDVNQQPRVLTLLPEPEARVPPQVRTPVLGFLALLMSVVGVVLLIACTNVANLMLARASVRRAEMGVRLALGATRGRIMRHLLSESVLLALLGGAVGVLLAFWGLRALTLGRLPFPVPVTLDVSMDLRVLAFAAAVTIATGILFGLLPALHASRAPAPLLRAAATRVTRLRLRNGLVIFQVAASLVLLVAGGLFLRSLLAAQRIDPGFNSESMVLVPFDLGTEGMTEAQAQNFYLQIFERSAALPGVEAVTLAERVPLGLSSARRRTFVPGYQPRPGEDMEFHFNGVMAGYFDAMGIPLLQGREFTMADRAGAPPVAIVNQAFVRKFWPGRSPLGEVVSMSGEEGPFMQIVGVVPDGKYRSLNEPPTPYFYYSYLQQPSPGMTLQLRTAGETAPVVSAIRAEIRALSPGMTPPEITTLRQHLALTTMPQRIAAAMLVVLGSLALLIAVVGLYGVVAYAVAQRTREFGIRMALGAVAGDVGRMVLLQGMRITAAGVIAGLAIGAGVAWAIRGFLLVPPFDPLTFALAPLLLAAAATLASWIPARRATRADPLEAIRAE